MKVLDRLLIDRFVEDVKAALAMEDKSILQTCGSASAWAGSYMKKPDGMDFVEFNFYCDIVGNELVVRNILRVDKRKHRGLPADHNPLRLRVNGKWWRDWA
jgi:hypothetical protein